MSAPGWDAQRTLFVGRLNFRTREKTLRALLEPHGTIRQLRLVTDAVTGVSRGYAFVEFETENGARRAQHACHHRKVDGRRILVDFEKGRTFEGWVPRRLGGGFGGKKESGQMRFGGIDKPFRLPRTVPLHPQDDPVLQKYLRFAPVPCPREPHDRDRHHRSSRSEDDRTRRRNSRSSRRRETEKTPERDKKRRSGSPSRKRRHH